MTAIGVKPAGPDRPRLTLQILAANPSGISTPALLYDAGETGRKGALTWYGNILRNAERNGWAERAGTVPGKRGLTIVWRITSAGRQRLADYDRARSEPTTRQAAAARRAQAAHDRANSTLMLAAARQMDMAVLTDRQKLILAASLRRGGCTLQEIGGVFGKSREYIRLALKYDAWPVTTAMIIRSAPRMDQVIERWQELGT